MNEQVSVIVVDLSHPSLFDLLFFGNEVRHVLLKWKRVVQIGLDRPKPLKQELIVLIKP